jgi:hypothetical protein
MAKNDSEFQKLLGEAPMAADTVTVVGILARTPDAACFNLTLPDGRTVTLDVDAVKSAKTIAGAIGQSLVELELDAKRVPESMRDVRPGGPGQLYLTHKEVTYDPHQKPLASDLKLIPEQGQKSPFEHGTVSVTGSEGYGPGVTPSYFALPPGGFAPFVAASPHQADPATIAALTQGLPGAHYLSHLIKSVPQRDIQQPPKQPVQDGTNPWNSFDITGGSAFDVITYNHGVATYHY